MNPQRAIVDPSKQEVYTICKSPDPTGTGDMGFMSTIRPQRLAVTLVRHGDLLLEADLYAAEGMPGQVEVLIFCPRCKHQLRIGPERKRIAFDLEATPAWVAPTALALPEPIVAVGRLDVERFECTWELDTDKPVGVSRAGENLCRWRAAIDNNVVREV